MKINVKDLMLGAALTFCVVVLLGAAGSSSSSLGKYQFAANSVYPDWYVVDTQTGHVYRYTVFAKPGDSDIVEHFRIESLGTPSEPEHKVVETIKGLPWKGYNSRPTPFTQY